MRDPQGYVVSATVREHVDPRYSTNASREVPAGRGLVAEHDLQALSAQIVHHRNERVVDLLRLRTDLEVVDLEDGAASQIAGREVSQHAGPFAWSGPRRHPERVPLGARQGEKRRARDGEERASRGADQLRRDAADQRSSDEAATLGTRRDQIRAHLFGVREKLRCRSSSKGEEGNFDPARNHELLRQRGELFVDPLVVDFLRFD